MIILYVHPLLGAMIQFDKYFSDGLKPPRKTLIWYIFKYQSKPILKGQLGVPLTVYSWYLLCSLGILGDYNP